jgi:hypothetical protein
MAARAGMNDARALRVLTGSFLAGLLCAAVVSAAIEGDGIDRPYFGLEAPAADEAATATPPPVQAAGQPGPEKPAVGDLARLAEALATTPPERLALEDAAAPQAAFLVAQAMPATSLPAEPAAADAGYVKVDGDAAPPPASGPLKALVARVQQRKPADHQPAPAAAPAETPSAAAPQPAAAPLPGAEWTDPDSVNWADAAGREAAAADGSRLRERIVDRLNGQPPSREGPLGNGRLLERLRSERRGGRTKDDAAPPDDRTADARQWPRPDKLVEQLDRLEGLATRGTAGDLTTWCRTTRGQLDAVLATRGPHDGEAATLLLALSDSVEQGMSAADRTADPVLATDARRTALAVARRVAVWRSASAAAAEGTAAGEPAAGSDVGDLLTGSLAARDTVRLPLAPPVRPPFVTGWRRSPRCRPHRPRAWLVPCGTTISRRTCGWPCIRSSCRGCCRSPP